MPAEQFVDALQEQVAHEFAASQQYIANAVWFDAQTLPRLAGFYYRQALEERTHALMMVKYLLDAGVEAEIPGVQAPKSAFTDIAEPVRLALDQERSVTDQITRLAHIAREAGDYQSEQFIQWFLKEQVEEVATAADLLAIVERARENPLLAEDFLAREGIGEETSDPTAPSAAGGSV